MAMVEAGQTCLFLNARRHLRADAADDPAASLRLANLALTGSLLLAPLLNCMSWFENGP
jgi:hypothetical protein